MGWLHVDWSAERPSTTALETSRRTVRFEPVTTDLSAVEPVLAAFRAMFTNGDVAIATVQVTHLDDAGLWFLSRRRLQEFGLTDCLVHSDGLGAVFPPAAAPVLVTDEFEKVSPLTLDGQIASQLVWGGAYGTFPDSWSAAKQLGRYFSDAVIGERYQDFQIEYSGTGWSPWFLCPAWDFTWVIVDRRYERIVVCCGTDTD